MRFSALKQRVRAEVHDTAAIAAAEGIADTEERTAALIELVVAVMPDPEPELDPVQRATKEREERIMALASEVEQRGKRLEKTLLERPVAATESDELAQAAGRGDMTTLKRMLTGQLFTPPTADQINARLYEWEATALQLCAVGGAADCMEMLIEAGADVLLRDRHGCTALHYAAQCGQTQCVRLLLAANAELDVVEKRKKWTALMKAAQRGHAPVMALLVEAGASTTIADPLGENALMLAARYSLSLSLSLSLCLSLSLSLSLSLCLSLSPSPSASVSLRVFVRVCVSLCLSLEQVRPRGLRRSGSRRP